MLQVARRCAAAAMNSGLSARSMGLVIEGRLSQYGGYASGRRGGSALLGQGVLADEGDVLVAGDLAGSEPARETPVGGIGRGALQADQLPAKCEADEAGGGGIRHGGRSDRVAWLKHSKNRAQSLGRVRRVFRAVNHRHRFLQAPKAVKPKRLEGTVETDETYFLQSQKGSRKLARPARKRGGSAKKCGLSDEQVPVLIARDRNKATTDEILPDRSERSITVVLEPVVDTAAVLVSDGAHAYRAFADHYGIAQIALNLSAGQRTWASITSRTSTITAAD